MPYDIAWVNAGGLTLNRRGRRGGRFGGRFVDPKELEPLGESARFLPFFFLAFQSGKDEI